MLYKEINTLEDDRMEEADTFDQSIVDDDFFIAQLRTMKQVVQVKRMTDDGDHFAPLMKKKQCEFSILIQKENNGEMELTDMTKLPQPTAGQGTARVLVHYTYNFDFD